MDQFIQGLPKAGLHIHIEGSLETELMFALAEPNGITRRFPDLDVPGAGLIRPHSRLSSARTSRSGAAGEAEF